MLQPQSTSSRPQGSFIDAERRRMAEHLTEQFDCQLFRDCPRPPIRLSAFEAHCRSECEQLLRCPKVRHSFLPPLPRLLRELIDDERSIAEQAQQLQTHLQREQALSERVLELIRTPFFNRQAYLWEASDAPLKERFHHFRCIVSMALAEPLYQVPSHYRRFCLRLWHYAHTAALVSQLRETEDELSYPSYVLCLLQPLGMVLATRYCDDQLRRRPDLEAQMTWLGYDTARRHGAALAYWIAHDWALPQTYLEALYSQYSGHSVTTPLASALQQTQLASKICYLYRFGKLSRGAAEHCLDQWQLPRHLLDDFKPAGSAVQH